MTEEKRCNCDEPEHLACWDDAPNPECQCCLNTCAALAEEPW